MSEEAKFNKKQYDAQYNKEHYGRIGIRWPKDKDLTTRIKTVADQEGISVNQWIIRAIEKELEWYE